jgi:hypothetical protein
VLNFNEVREYGETIINMLQILSKPNLFIGTLGFSNKYSKRRIIMISSFNKKSIAGTVIALCLVFMVGCSSTAKTLSGNSNGTNAIANKTNSNASSTNNVTNTASTNKLESDKINKPNKQENVAKQNSTTTNNSNSTPVSNNNKPSQASTKTMVIFP